MDKFEAIKAKILAYLDSLERKEETAKKAVKLGMKLEKAVYPVGTVRVWKGKRYRKIAPGKWRPTYDSHSRGAKQAIAHLKRKIANMDNPEDIMKLMLEHRDRFSDAMGRPMPFVQELSDYIKSKEYQDVKAAGENTKIGKEKKTYPDYPERSKGEQEKIDQDWADWNKVYNKYKAARKEEGDDAEIYVNGKAIQGVWQLVEADTPTASHDENTFNMTPGFPINSDGTTMNDRDYQHDRFAQESVLKFGSDYDGRALSFDNPVVVSQEGIVISGNNRTMSSKRAARAETDKKYIEALRKRAHIYGFGPDLVDDFEHPRVIFQTHVERYTTDEFAKYNKGTKKEMGPTEKAVKVSKLIKQDTVDSVARQIGEHETMGELYQDRKATAQIIEEFTRANLIGENELGRYLENGVLTEDGKQFIETALLGTVINEGNLRRFNQPGARSIRATLVRGLAPLVENKSLSGYSINKELNEAVDIIIQVATDRETFKTVQDFADQKDMFEEYDPIAMELAKKLEGTQKQFAEFMQSINGGLKVASAGEADIFLGGVESRDDVIARYINVKKSVIEAIRDFGASRLIKSLRGFYR